MTDYRITNLHSTARSYENNQGQQISFAPGEQKTLKSTPPESHSAWEVEIVEETSKPEDIEHKEGGE